MSWKVSNTLTGEQLEVLKAVNFPLELKLHQKVQKRIKKIPIRGGFVDKPNPELSDMVYLIVSKNTADYFSKFTKTEDAIRAESFTATYIGQNEIQAELDNLLNKFAPSMTPSMKKALKQVEELKQEEKQPQLLTEEQQQKAAELAQLGKDLKEIAKALGVAQKVVKPFLLTLNK